MSGSIVRKSEANIRKFGRMVSCIHSAISTSDSKVSMFGPAMNWIAPILIIFAADWRIAGTITLHVPLDYREIKMETNHLKQYRRAVYEL